MLHAEVASLSEWVDACSSAFVPLGVRSANPHFSASLAQAELIRGVTVTFVSSRASEVFRDQRVITANPREDVLLSLHRAGSGAVTQHGRTAKLTPGGAALYDASSPYTLSFPAQMREIVIQLPRRTLVSVGHAFEDFTARLLQPSGPLRALTALAGAVDPNARHRSAEADEAVAESLASLVRAALALGDLDAPPPLEAELLALAIRTHIDEHAADHELTPESLAHTFHISLRYLQKLFSQDGGEPPATHIRQRRLEISTELLRSDSSVLQAAQQSGFSDVDTFSRAFKREYGLPPSALMSASASDSPT